LNPPNNFQLRLDIRISDLNYGAHVGHTQLLDLIHEARLQFLQQYGQSELKFYEGSLILISLSVEFKSQLFYADSILINVSMEKIRKTRFQLTYTIMNEKNNKTVAIAKTEMACFDYQNNKLRLIPDAFIQIFEPNQ